MLAGIKALVLAMLATSGSSFPTPHLATRLPQFFLNLTRSNLHDAHRASDQIAAGRLKGDWLRNTPLAVIGAMTWRNCVQSCFGQKRNRNARPSPTPA